MKSRSHSAARQWARALLEVAEAKGQTASLDVGLLELEGLLSANEELRRTLANPALPNEKKKAIASRIVGSGSPILVRFLGILLDHGLSDLVPQVAESFHALFNARRGVTRAEAVVATPLDQEQSKALEKALSGTQGGAIELKTSIDPALLGGVLVRMGGKTYDGTVRAHLQALKQALAGES